MNSNNYDSLESNEGDMVSSSYTPLLFIVIIAVIIILIYVVFYTKKSDDVETLEVEESEELSPINISDSNTSEKHIPVYKVSDEPIQEDFDNSPNSGELSEESSEDSMLARVNDIQNKNE